MQRVTATFRQGRLELTEPVDWPEGTLVVWEYGVQPERVDFCFDGSPWEDTRHGVPPLFAKRDVQRRKEVARP